MKKKKILIIEDNADLVDMYKVKFASEGFEVSSAPDGEEGIVKVVQEKPDAILLDILMPNMNGMEVLKAIKDNTEMDVKIIVLSNLSQQDQIKKAYDLGATHYMVKVRHTPAQVVEKVKEIVDVSSVSEKEYLLKIMPDAYDYQKFLNKSTASKIYKECSACNGEVVVKLIDKSDHWEAEFVCTNCKKKVK